MSNVLAKPRRTVKRRYLFIVIGFILLIGGAGGVWLHNRSKPKPAINQNVVLPEVAELKVVPKDVNAYGSATRAFATRGVNAAYLHTVKVRLPDIITKNTEYYGWIAKPDKSHIIKTGKLIKYPSDGLFHLEFRDTKDYEGYDLVLITAEQRDDNAPELTLMEGKFR